MKSYSFKYNQDLTTVNTIPEELKLNGSSDLKTERIFRERYRSCYRYCFTIDKNLLPEDKILYMNIPLRRYWINEKSKIVFLNVEDNLDMIDFKNMFYQPGDYSSSYYDTPSVMEYLNVDLKCLPCLLIDDVKYMNEEFFPTDHTINNDSAITAIKYLLIPFFLFKYIPRITTFKFSTYKVFTSLEDLEKHVNKNEEKNNIAYEKRKKRREEAEKQRELESYNKPIILTSPRLRVVKVVDNKTTKGVKQGDILTVTFSVEDNRGSYAPDLMIYKNDEFLFKTTNTMFKNFIEKFLIKQI
jgi:hypothetical protein